VPIEKKPPTSTASQKKQRAPKGPSAKTKRPTGGTASMKLAARRHAAAGTPTAARPPAAKSSASRPPAAKPVPVKPAIARPSLKRVVLDALDDMKALEIKVLDVRGLTDIADYMVIASGTSDRHVRSVAQRVVEKTKEAGFRPHGLEGLQDGDWVLIDLHEYIVHVMLPRVREFYGLEKLWDMTAKRAVRA
jgi:ribosome silencing factor RsfS/YbeB/iojap